MWLKSEMRIHNNGYVALAAAVLKQWKHDGQPVGDDVTLWRDVIASYKKRMLNVKHGEVMK